MAVLLIAAFLRLYRLDDVPPGLYSDIATNGLDIRDIFAGHPSIFFPANNGREALFIYFQALLVAGAGMHLVVLTFAAVAMGVLSVALTYRLFTEMLGYRVGVLAAGLLASAFWAVLLSRIGLRFSSLPVFLLAILYLLHRTLHSTRRRYAVALGVALGASLYTYTSAWLLPELVVVICGLEFRLVRKRLPQLALSGLLALIVFSPEGVYFLQHRDQMFKRAEQVSVFNPKPEVERKPATPWESLSGTAGMFFVRGDQNQLRNIPGRPVFDPPLAAFFVLGLVLLLGRSRSRPAYRWLLAWLVVMGLAGALSQDSPDFFRLYPLAPLASAIAAIGLVAAGSLLTLPFAASALSVAAVLWAACWTGVLYFGKWASDPRTYQAYGADTYKLAGYLAGRPEPRMMFGYHLRWPVELLVPRTTEGEWFELDNAAVPVPSRDGGDVLFVAQPASALRGLNSDLLPGLTELPPSIGPTGSPDFLAFHWPAASAAQFLAAQTALPGNMSPDFRLRAYSLKQRSGGIALRVLWEPLATSGPYDLWVHLVDGSGKQIAQSDVLARGPEDGPPSGYLLLTEHPLSAAPGAYTAEIGATHRSWEHPEEVVGGAIGEVVKLPVRVE